MMIKHIISDDDQVIIKAVSLVGYPVRVKC